MSMKSLDEVNILLLYAKFFNYDQIVKTKLEELGAHVELFDARAEVSTFEKAVKKFYRGQYQKKQIAFHNGIQQKLENINFDYVFSNSFLPKETVMGYRKKFPSAKLVLYLDDSVANLRGVEQTFELYDRVITFDRADACKYSIEFRPLFYADSFANTNNDENKMENDICFIGTVHSDRLKVIEKIEKICKTHDKTFFTYCYLQSKVMFYIYYILKKEFRHKKKNYFKYVPMKSDLVAKTMSNSFAILDIQHPKQTGLTMRTIETVGSRKKMITTNADIKNYDLYNPHNICIIDRNNPEISDEFFTTSYEVLLPEIQYKYSIDGWINYIFR